MFYQVDELLSTKFYRDQSNSAKVLALLHINTVKNPGVNAEYGIKPLSPVSYSSRQRE